MLLWAWSLFIHFVHFFLPPLIFPLSLSPSSIFSSSQVGEWAEGKEHNIYAPKHYSLGGRQTMETNRNAWTSGKRPSEDYTSQLSTLN